MKGGLTTTLTKEQATKYGEELLAMMDGDCWGLRVHENLGWHYCVKKGGMTVYYSHKKYSCLFSSDGKSSGGDAFWTPERRLYKNPNDAVKAQIKCSLAFMHKCKNTLTPFIELL